METAESYRQNAADCRKLAAKMEPAVREQLHRMAETWEQLAEERERNVEKDGQSFAPSH